MATAGAVAGARVAASEGVASARAPGDAVFGALRESLRASVGSPQRRSDVPALCRRVKSALQYGGAVRLLPHQRTTDLVSHLTTALATAEPEEDGEPWDARALAALIDATEWLAWRLAYWWFVDGRIVV